MYNNQPSQYPPYPQYSQYPQYPQQPQGGGVWYTPIPQAQTNRRPSQAKNKRAKGSGSGRGNGQGPRRPAKRKSFTWQFVKFLLVLALLGGLSIWAYMQKVQSDVRPYLNVFLDNISVDGIKLSGMTWMEGSEAVWAQANAKQTSWYVRLKSSTGAYKDITAADLGIAFDPSQALRDAWAIGHETSSAARKTIFQLKEEIEYMKASSAEFFSAEQSADTAPIDSILQTLETSAYRAPQAAKITGFNPDDTVNPFTFQSEQMGQHLDTTAIKEQILQMVHNFESGEILLAPEPLAPEVTVAELQKTVALRSRVTTPIDKHSSEERIENIRLAFSKFNGLQLGNGAAFSFNKVVGKRSEKNGFKPAFEYTYGELVTGFGGGVCQASTTLYIAAIQSGLTIEKRTNHGTPVNYTNLGMDATVSDTPGHEKDFVFRNNSGAPVYIVAHVIPDNANKNRYLCEVRIYGAELGNVRYELKTEVVEVIPAPEEPERVEDTEGTNAYYVDQEVMVSKATEGSVVESYLETYVDGQLADRAFVAKDTYPARKAKVFYGINPRFE